MNTFSQSSCLEEIDINAFISADEPTLSIHLTIREATLVMYRLGLKHMIAIDNEKRIHGAITHSTIFRCVALDDRCLERLVIDYIDRDPLYVRYDEKANRVLEKMIHAGKDYTLVLRNNTIIGIVRLLDILNYMLKKC